MNRIDMDLRKLPNSSDTSMWSSRRWHDVLNCKHDPLAFVCASISLNVTHKNLKHGCNVWDCEHRYTRWKRTRASANQTSCFIKILIFDKVLMRKLFYLRARTTPEKVVLLLQPFQPVIGRHDSWVRRLKVCCLQFNVENANVWDWHREKITCNASISRTLRRTASSALPRRSSIRLNFNMSDRKCGPNSQFQATRVIFE